MRHRRDIPPAVLSYQHVYCVLTMLLSLVIVAGAALTLADLDDFERGSERSMALIENVAMLLLGLVSMGAYARGLFTRPTKGWWIYHLVLISLGLTTCCCWPAAIPLLIYWLKPETKAWFGYGMQIPDVF